MRRASSRPWLSGELVVLCRGGDLSRCGSNSADLDDNAFNVQATAEPMAVFIDDGRCRVSNSGSVAWQVGSYAFGFSNKACLLASLSLYVLIGMFDHVTQ